MNSLYKTPSQQELADIAIAKAKLSLYGHAGIKEPPPAPNRNQLVCDHEFRDAAGGRYCFKEGCGMFERQFQDSVAAWVDQKEKSL